MAHSLRIFEIRIVTITRMDHHNISPQEHNHLVWRWWKLTALLLCPFVTGERQNLVKGAMGCVFCPQILSL